MDPIVVEQEEDVFRQMMADDAFLDWIRVKWILRYRRIKSTIYALNRQLFAIEISYDQLPILVEDDEHQDELEGQAQVTFPLLPSQTRTLLSAWSAEDGLTASDPCIYDSAAYESQLTHSTMLVHGHRMANRLFKDVLPIKSMSAGHLPSDKQNHERYKLEVCPLVFFGTIILVVTAALGVWLLLS